MACQTVTPPVRTVSTQLSITTLQPHYQSKGIQTQFCPDVGVHTAYPLMSSTPVKRVSKVSKRPRLELEEEEQQQDPLEGTPLKNHWILHMILQTLFHL